MNTKNYISVIIACYNGENYIAQAIESVLRQPVDLIELIVIDDGSTDNTPEICKKYIDKIHYFRTPNLGAGHARNFGMQNASGKWVAFLDADDLYLTNAFDEERIKKLKEYEENNIDIIYTPFITSDINLKTYISIEPSEDISEIKYIQKHEFWTCLYSNKYLTDNNISFYEFKEQDIASAFRFMSLLYSPRIVTDNLFCFYLQRINFNSNTYTWNDLIVSRVKAMVYFDLIGKCKTDDARIWCMNEVISQLKLFYKASLHRKPTKLDKQKADTIVKSLFSKDYYRLIKTRQYLSLIKDILRSYINIKNNNHYSSSLLKQKIADNKDIFRRLDLLSRFVCDDKPRNAE